MKNIKVLLLVTGVKTALKIVKHGKKQTVESLILQDKNRKSFRVSLTKMFTILQL